MHNCVTNQQKKLEGHKKLLGQELLPPSWHAAAAAFGRRDLISEMVRV